MDVILEQLSKRYTTGWVLKDLSKKITQGQKVAITGANGSGKSTLIQIISGYLSATKGQIRYLHDGKEIVRDEIFRKLAISAAYMELDEELSIKEMFQHYRLFKPLCVEYQEFLKLTDFENADDKQVRYFSSGMKQRLALGFAFVTDVPLLLLDEPTSFLDDTRKSWYAEMMEQFAKEKTVIIASNDEFDIKNCTENILLN